MDISSANFSLLNEHKLPQSNFNEDKQDFFPDLAKTVQFCKYTFLEQLVFKLHWETELITSDTLELVLSFSIASEFKLRESLLFSLLCPTEIFKVLQFFLQIDLWWNLEEEILQMLADLQ